MFKTRECGFNSFWNNVKNCKNICGSRFQRYLDALPILYLTLNFLFSVTSNVSDDRYLHNVCHTIWREMFHKHHHEHSNALNCIFANLQVSKNPGNWDGLVGVQSLGKTSITLKTCLRLLPAPSIEYFVFNVINVRHQPRPPPTNTIQHSPCNSFWPS